MTFCVCLENVSMNRTFVLIEGAIPVNGGQNDYEEMYANVLRRGP